MGPTLHVLAGYETRSSLKTLQRGLISMDTHVEAAYRLPRIGIGVRSVTGIVKI